METIVKLRDLLGEYYNSCDDLELEIHKILSRGILVHAKTPNIPLPNSKKLMNSFFSIVNNSSISPLEDIMKFQNRFRGYNVFEENTEWEVSWLNHKKQKMHTANITISRANKTYYGNGKNNIHECFFVLKKITPYVDKKDQYTQEYQKKMKSIHKALFLNARNVFVEEFFNSHLIDEVEENKAQENYRIFLNKMGIHIGEVPKEEGKARIYLKSTIESVPIDFGYKDLLEIEIVKRLFESDDIKSVIKGRTSLKKIYSQVKEYKNKEIDSYNCIINKLQGLIYEN